MRRRRRLGSFTVNGGTQAHPPGSYVSGTVNGGTLQLTAGDYFFQSLTSNAGVTVRAAAGTRIFVRDNLVFNSPIRASGRTGMPQSGQSGNEVYELFHDGSQWNGNNLTVNGVPNCP